MIFCLISVLTISIDPVLIVIPIKLKKKNLNTKTIICIGKYLCIFSFFIITVIFTNFSFFNFKIFQSYTSNKLQFYTSNKFQSYTSN